MIKIIFSLVNSFCLSVSMCLFVHLCFSFVCVSTYTVCMRESMCLIAFYVSLSLPSLFRSFTLFLLPFFPLFPLLSFPSFLAPLYLSSPKLLAILYNYELFSSTHDSKHSSKKKKTNDKCSKSDNKSKSYINVS